LNKKIRAQEAEGGIQTLAKWCSYPRLQPVAFGWALCETSETLGPPVAWRCGTRLCQMCGKVSAYSFRLFPALVGSAGDRRATCKTLVKPRACPSDHVRSHGMLVITGGIWFC